MKKSEVIKAHVTPSLKNKIKEFAMHRNKSESEIIDYFVRIGIEHYIKNKEQPSKDFYGLLKETQIEMLAAINTLNSQVIPKAKDNQALLVQSSHHFSELQRAKKFIEGIERNLNKK